MSKNTRRNWLRFVMQLVANSGSFWQLDKPLIQMEKKIISDDHRNKRNETQVTRKWYEQPQISRACLSISLNNFCFIYFSAERLYVFTDICRLYNARCTLVVVLRTHFSGLSSVPILVSDSFSHVSDMYCHTWYTKPYFDFCTCRTESVLRNKTIVYCFFHVAGIFDRNQFMQNKNYLRNNKQIKAERRMIEIRRERTIKLSEMVFWYCVNNFCSI